MPTTTLKGSRENGFIDGDVDPELLASLANDMAPLGTSVDSRVGVLLELQGIKAAIRTWFTKQPDQVIREASAYSARLTEMWTDLQLLEPHDRQWVRLRTMQVEPVIREVDRQFDFARSRIAMARQDLELSK